MSEFKGTKGKWEILLDKKSNGYTEVISDNIEVCTCYGGFERTSPNAKLIVCAPEMLEELKKAKSTISRLKNSMRSHPDCVEDSEFADYVDLAEFNEDSIELLIKKATE